MEIEAKNLTFRYGGRVVLEGITFLVEQGVFIGIIGPNGSGKTTLLRLLCRSLFPAAGSVQLGGRDLTSYSQKELARLMAVVTQDAGAGHLFTVEEMVAMGRAPFLGRFRGESENDRIIIRQALEMTGCLHLRGRLVGELSGGERQRVMIARALAQKPRVLLLDEPTSHLDIGYQQEVLDMIKHLNASRGMTVVAVLHDLNLAAYYCNRLIMLSNGKVFAAGAPAEVVTAINIGSVYRTRVLVTAHAALGTPAVLPLPGGRLAPEQRRQRIHVLAGGGSAGDLLRDLKAAGFMVSAGVLNVGDSDWEAARALDIDMVVEAPFSDISAERHRENMALVAGADAVVLAEIPVGRGNLLNLQAALEAGRAGKKLFIIEERPERQRDFTGGEGSRLLAQIKKGRAAVIGDKAELYRALAELFPSGDHSGKP